MKGLRLLSTMVICVLICTACQTTEDSEIAENYTESTSTSSYVSTTDISQNVITEETSNTTTITENESTTDTEEATESNGNETTNYDDMVILTHTDSKYITEDMCNEISEYFRAMTEVDVDTFKSKQLSAYNTYMEEYLEENSSSFEDMLEVYNNNYLTSSGSDENVYSSYTLNEISLEYPNDVDSILNTMTYINQLDTITYQYEDYTISTQLTAYYELDYTINYTLMGDGVEDFEGTKVGSILVLDIDGEISLIMLT